MYFHVRHVCTSVPQSPAHREARFRRPGGPAEHRGAGETVRLHLTQSISFGHACPGIAFASKRFTSQDGGSQQCFEEVCG